MTIIGLTGPIGHGKSTLAGYFTSGVDSSIHIESSTVIAEFAEQIYVANSSRDLPQPEDITGINAWLSVATEIVRKFLAIDCVFDRIEIYPEEVARVPSEYEKLFQHISDLNDNPRLLTQPINEDNKSTYRPFLQWLGGYFVQKIDSGIWYNEIVRRIRLAKVNGCELATVGGLRFPKDGEILRQ